MNAREWIGAIGIACSITSMLVTIGLFCSAIVNPMTVTLMILSLCVLFLSPMLYA